MSSSSFERALAQVVLLGAAHAGCAPDSRLTYAEDTVRASSIAVAEVQTSGSENEVLEAPLALASARLAETEHAIEVWRDHGGPLAFSTHAPCLRAALIALRDAMLTVPLVVPSALDEADGLLEGVGGRCP